MTAPVITVSRRTVLRQGALALAGALLPATPARAEVGPVMSTLSAYMAAARDRDLPPAILEATRQHVLDTLAAMISGSELAPGRAALAFARAQAGAPIATVVASSIITSAAEAALLNGVLAHSDETDDSH